MSAVPEIYSKKLSPTDPYKGLGTFLESDKDYFKGRSSELDRLYELVTTYAITLLFGKSGMGKSSLLQAGLIPRLRQTGYYPIYIRIDFGMPDLLQQVKDTIYAETVKVDKNFKPAGERTLWEYLHRESILDGLLSPVLIFDQFEEYFTRGRTERKQEEIINFVREMSDLIENKIPDTVQRKLMDEDDIVDSTYQKADYKIIFSFREEYLPQFEGLKFRIPSLKDSRFRLTHLIGKNALAAILEPGKEIIEKEEAIRILQVIPSAQDAEYAPDETRTDDWSTKKIEPFILSLYCDELNKKRSATGKITKSLINDTKVDDILRQHYFKNIEKLGSKKAASSIEEELLTEGGKRRFSSVNQLIEKYKMSESQIQLLVDNRVIRRETRNEGEYVELIHDKVAEVVFEERNKRRRRKRAVRVGAAGAFIFVTMFTLLFIFGRQKTIRIAREAEIEARARAEEEAKADFSRQGLLVSIDSLNKVIVAKDDINKALITKGLGDVTVKDKVVNDLRSQISALEIANKSLQNEQNNASQENTSLNQKVNEQKDDLNAKQAEIDRLTKEKSSLQSSLDATKKDLDSKTNTVNDLQRQLKECDCPGKTGKIANPFDTTKIK